MNTLVLAETRAIGAEWMNTHVPKNPADEKRRTQTEIFFNNGDYMVVLSKETQFRGRPVQQGDKAVVVGNVDASFLEAVVKAYADKKIALELNQAGGQVLTATELKRRRLLQQMEDLDKEERLHSFFKEFRLDGVTINRFNISVANPGRTFSINIDGKFV